MYWSVVLLAEDLDYQHLKPGVGLDQIWLRGTSTGNMLPVWTQVAHSRVAEYHEKGLPGSLTRHVARKR